jgi:hypothetical protein
MAKIKTERAWLSSGTPSSLLSVLKGKRLPRQRRQIAVACCRRVVGLMEDPRSRKAVEVSDRFLDGGADALELEEAFLLAQGLALGLIERATRAGAADHAGTWNAWRLAYAAQLCAARTGMDEAPLVLLKRAANLGMSEEAREKAELCAIIRDVVGNPFRPPPAIDPAWLAWHDGLVAAVAGAMYQEGRFADMPVLADALEDAGCADQQLLTHCRSGGLHVRGCWAVELLLGKR